MGGQFLLRFEDIDHTRVRGEFYEGIEEDLRWLGMDWEGTAMRQLDRLAVYEEALESLRGMGLLYRCFCTRKELVAAAPQEGDGGAIYSGTCRALSKEETERREAAGESFCWRLEMAAASERVGELSFEDEGLGRVLVKPWLLGDPVLARKDIATSYHLAVVVDDEEQGVTEVIRGEDLLESTHVHRVLQALFGFSEPRYWHHRLVTDSEGKRLAKRHDSLAIATLRGEGWTPEEVIAEGKKLGGMGREWWLWSRVIL